MRLPVIISKTDLSEIRRVEPLRMSISMVLEGTPTAEMILLNDEPLAMGDWMRVYTPQNESFVARVTNITTDYYGGTKTVKLEHLIASLNDGIIWDEFEADCTVTEIVRWMLTKQQMWSLGRCEYGETNPYSFASTNITDALNTVVSALSNSMVSYSMDELPFKLHILHRPSEASCEMRSNRNISSLQQNVDTSDMYTRIYPIGAEDLKLPEKYLSKNEDIYGMRCHMEDNPAIEKEALLRKWAQARLDRFCEPSVTVKISGTDLSESTGEPFDRLKVGTVCRVPLNEYNTTICEIISSVSWGNALADPEAVTVTLANDRRTVSTIIRNDRNMMKTASRAGGRGGRKNKEQIDENEVKMWTTFEKTDERITLTANRLEANDNLMQTMINQNADEITLEATRAKGKEDELQSSIRINADAITLKASKVYVDGQLRAQKADIDRIDSIASTAAAGKFNVIVVGNRTCTPKSVRVKDSSGNNYTLQYLGWGD